MAAVVALVEAVTADMARRPGHRPTAGVVTARTARARMRMAIKALSFLK
jgi:hypothetical protein